MDDKLKAWQKRYEEILLEMMRLKTGKGLQVFIPGHSITHASESFQELLESVDLAFDTAMADEAKGVLVANQEGAE